MKSLYELTKTIGQRYPGLEYLETQQWFHEFNHLVIHYKGDMNLVVQFLDSNPLHYKFNKALDLLLVGEREENHDVIHPANKMDDDEIDTVSLDSLFLKWDIGIEAKRVYKDLSCKHSQTVEQIEERILMRRKDSDILGYAEKVKKLLNIS